MIQSSNFNSQVLHLRQENMFLRNLIAQHQIEILQHIKQKEALKQQVRHFFIQLNKTELPSLRLALSRSQSLHTLVLDTMPKINLIWQRSEQDMKDYQNGSSTCRSDLVKEQSSRKVLGEQNAIDSSLVINYIKKKESCSPSKQINKQVPYTLKEVKTLERKTNSSSKKILLPCESKRKISYFDKVKLKNQLIE